VCCSVLQCVAVGHVDTHINTQIPTYTIHIHNIHALIHTHIHAKSAVLIRFVCVYIYIYIYGVGTTCDRVMSHIWMSHVAPTNETCHTCEWVMSHIRKSHVTHVCKSMRESRHIYGSDMSNTRHVTHVNGTCHIYERVMSHLYEWVTSYVRMSHIPHEEFRTCEFEISHIQKSHVTCLKQCHTYETLFHHVTGMKHFSVCVKSLILTQKTRNSSWCHTYETRFRMCEICFIRVTSLLHNDVTRMKQHVTRMKQHVTRMKQHVTCMKYYA